MTNYNITKHGHNDSWSQHEKQMPNYIAMLDKQTSWDLLAAKKFITYKVLDYSHISTDIRMRNLYKVDKENKDFGFWFNYFAKEVSWKGVNIEIIQKLLSLIFGSPDDLDSNEQLNKVKSEIDKLVISQMEHINNKESKDDPYYFTPPNNPLDKQLLLGAVRALGFLPVIPQNVQQLVRNENVEDWWLALKTVFPIHIILSSGDEKKYNGDTNVIAIVFRGDSRSFDEVQKHKGTIAKAQLGLENTNAKWNPFQKDPWMYIREGSGDNCLYSVISIASSDKLSLGFPLLEDKNIYPIKINLSKTIKQNFDQWDNIEYQKIYKHKHSIKYAEANLKHKETGQLSTQGVFLTETHLYISCLSGEYINTQALVEEIFNNPPGRCKERGVRSVLLKQLLAGVKLLRFHLGPIRTDGILAEVKELKYCYDDGKQNFFHDRPDIKKIASQHFFGDQQEAQKIVDILSKKYNIGNYLQGEYGDEDKDEDSIPYEIQKYQIKYPTSSELSVRAFSQPSSTLGSSHEPILLNGAKVIFDQAVATTPVTLEPKTTHR
ncbi:MAG: hypothetical protein F6K21_32050 [Symploca sp. SIO2D2]|nr:hypothetical protein [Symploca sp. SIO2D2]